ncbi:hypothetical protein LCGC14_0373070 [marine sediment metagenome]|uniref:Uncharacterized protein n=1 Tax=marine sediment metagenome TaxID=412755 RepID=A0A0F9TME4_9ZZZZ
MADKQKRTLSFADTPSNERTPDDETIKSLVAHVKRLEFNITAFIARVKHIQFDVNAENAALWMLDWENEILDGDLRDEEDDAVEDTPISRGTVRPPGTDTGGSVQA